MSWPNEAAAALIQEYGIESGCFHFGINIGYGYTEIKLSVPASIYNQFDP